MEQLLGTSWDVYLGVTVVLAGGIACLMGQAIARSWLPAWQVDSYSLLPAACCRSWNTVLKT